MSDERTTIGAEIQINQAILRRIAARWVRERGRNPSDYGWFLGNWRALPGLTSYLLAQPEMQPEPGSVDHYRQAMAEALRDD